VLLLGAARARADDYAAPLRDGCVNEIGVLCRGLMGSRLLRCLDDARDDALPGCRSSIDAEHDRIDQARAAREAAVAEARVMPEQGEEIEARIVGVTGPVYVHTAGMPEGQFAKVEAGTPLSAGDMIRTGAGGGAELSIDGKSLIALTPGSDFTIDSLNPEETEFHLGLGRLVAKLAKVLEGRQLRFVTPSAVAAVRGTELVVEQPEDGTVSRIGVLDEGHVAVSAPGGGAEVIVGPNQETEVPKGGAPSKARPLAALQSAKATIQQVRQRVTQVQKQWVPQKPEARVAQRQQLAKRPPLAAAALAGVAPRQQARAYPDARQRQTDLRQRRAPARARAVRPQTSQAPGGQTTQEPPGQTTRESRGQTPQEPRGEGRTAAPAERRR
jgi:hypothetical protein